MSKELDQARATLAEATKDGKILTVQQGRELAAWCSALAFISIAASLETMLAGTEVHSLVIKDGDR